MNIRKLESVRNERVKAAVRAARTGKLSRGASTSDERDVLFLEGPHLIEEALKAGMELVEVFFTSEYRERDREGLIKRIGAEAKETEVYEVTNAVMDKLSSTKTPQGICALADKGLPEAGEAELSDPPLFVVLDGISEPGNLGTIIRSAVGAGVDLALLTEGETADPFSPKALRASAGAAFHIPLITGLSVSELGALKEERSILFAGLSAHGGRSLYEAALGGPLALVVGSEAHGISPALRELLDIEVSIPLRGPIESLNAGAAAAVALYEIKRSQRA